jgi:hypothetical protein
MLVTLVGQRSNRSGIGARLRLTAAGRTQVREVKGGSSYLGQNDPRVHFGLGPRTMADRLEIQWPSGQTDVVERIAANRLLTVREGAGLVAERPLSRPASGR